MPLFGSPNIEKLKERRNVDGLIKALSHKDAAIRRDAARALGVLGDQRAVEPLGNLLLYSHGKAEVRGAAAAALGELGSHAAQQVLRIALDSDSARSVRAAAATALQKTLPAEDGERVSPQASVRQRHANVDSAIIGLASKNPRVRERAIQAFVEVKDVGAVDQIITILEEHDAFPSREAAAIALGRIGDARAGQALVAALRDKYARVRSAAAAALGDLGYLAAADELASVIRSDVEVREEATRALERMPGLKASLIADLNDSDRDVRLRAADLLGCVCIRDRGDALQPLVTALKDADETVRMAAVNSLGMVGTTDWLRTIPPLVATLNDPVPAVSKTASRVLAELKGRPFRREAPLIAALEADRLDWLRSYAVRFSGPGGVWPTDPDLAAEAIRFLIAVGDLDDSVADKLAKTVTKVKQECKDEDTSHGGFTLWQMYGDWINAANDFLDSHAKGT